MSNALTYEKNDSGVLIIDSKDEHNKGGFKMLFTGTEGKPAQFVLTDEIAKAHKTTVAKLKEQIESSPLFGNTFWAA